MGAQNSNTAGGYVFPCTTELPDFTFNIANVPFTIPGEYLNYEPLGNGNCYGGIQVNSGVGQSIFGDVALKAFYVVFDSRGPQLGFATKALNLD
ncbi:aspartic peptidase domain-containing protein [Diplogelasinospora grovesii]|uniref:Aspartic peptidase domain-containing protein n=1 Tax=Diplogelasinospora grovesii TaxID=303347 RepID=A0AAN6NEI1_9PEZI|nr:aspartic peptidase domain-containing protein [Diplogelasinospora grovesii]